MWALIFSIVFSEAMVTFVLFKLFEYSLLKALLTSAAVIAFYLLVVCTNRTVSVFMARMVGMYKDAEREKTVRRIMDKYGLMKHAPKDLEIRIIKKDDLNAYAFWRNILGVNTGLLEKAGEAEVAAVIGHELGHLYYKDSLYSTCAWSMLAPGVHALIFLSMLVSMSVALLLSFLGDERISCTAMIVIATATTMLAKLFTVFIMARSRWCEHRADLFAASISPEVREGVMSFLNRSAAMVPKEPGLYIRLYGTHPSPKRRIQKVKEVFPDAKPSIYA